MAINFVRTHDGGDESLHFQPIERLKVYLFGVTILFASFGMGEAVYRLLFSEYDGMTDRIPIEVLFGLVFARQEEDRKGTTVEVSKAIRRCQNRGVITTAGQAPTEPVYGRSGIRHERWPELAKEADRRNMGSLQVMLRENL